MKRIVLIGGAVLVLLLAAVAAVPFLIDPNAFRPMLEARLSQALGREVKLGELKLSILSGSVTANDLSIADDPAYSRTPFVQAKSLAIGVEVWPLIASRQLHVTGLTIDGPAIALIQAPNGEWNFSKLGASRSAEPPKVHAEPAPAAKTDMDLSVKLVKITGGRFSVGTTVAHARPLVLEDVKLEVHDFSSSSAFPFTFETKVAGGGTVKLDGKAGPLDAVDVAASPLGATLDVEKLDLAGTGLMQNAPAIAGLIGFHAAVQSDGKTGHVQGKLKAENLKLAKDGKPATRPVEFAFTVDHNLGKHSGQLHQGAIKIGSASASLNGSYAEDGGSAILRMKSGRTENGDPRACLHAAGNGNRAAQRVFTAGRHGQYRCRPARSGGAPGHHGHAFDRQHQTRRVRHQQEDGFDREVRGHQRRARHGDTELRRHAAYGPRGGLRRTGCSSSYPHSAAWRAAALRAPRTCWISKCAPPCILPACSRRWAGRRSRSRCRVPQRTPYSAPT